MRITRPPDIDTAETQRRLELFFAHPNRARNTRARVRALDQGRPEQTDIGAESLGPDRNERVVKTNTRDNIDALKTAKAVVPFTVDNKSRALQQQGLLAYVRELATRMPEFNSPRKYQEHDSDTRLAGFYEPMLKDGNRSTHAPTRTHQDLATALALTVKGNAAAIVHNADYATDGVAICCKPIKAYGQSGDDGTAYLLQLKKYAFFEAGDANVFSSKFVAICDDFRNTTGSAIPSGIQRTSLLNALHTRRWHHRHRRRHADIERARSTHTTVPEPHVPETQRRRDAANDRDDLREHPLGRPGRAHTTQGFICPCARVLRTRHLHVVQRRGPSDQTRKPQTRRQADQVQ